MTHGSEQRLLVCMLPSAGMYGFHPASLGQIYSPGRKAALSAAPLTL